MAFRVTFVDRGGKRGSSTFPTMAMASAYARTVRGAKIEETDLAVADVSVSTCPEGTLEAQREASREYHPTRAERAGQAPPRGAYLPAAARAQDAAFARQRRDEMAVEYVTQGRLYGGNVNDLLDDLAHIRD